MCTCACLIKTLFNGELLPQPGKKRKEVNRRPLLRTHAFRKRTGQIGPQCKGQGRLVNKSNKIQKIYTYKTFHKMTNIFCVEFGNVADIQNKTTFVK